MGYRVVRSDDHLAHYGVKGMKWGVRRYQNKDGSLTAAGKERYGEEANKASIKLVKAKKNAEESKKLLKKTNVYNVQLYDKREKAYRQSKKEVEFARQDLNNAKIDKKLKTFKKSTHFKNLEAQYIKDGMTKEEAQRAAYKRVKAQRVMLIAGAVAVAGISAYAYAKYRDEHVDKVLAKGELLARVSANKDSGVHDGFYAVIAKNKTDSRNYTGMYARALQMQGNHDVYQKKLATQNTLKIASRNSAHKTLEELVRNDKSFANEFDSLIGKTRNGKVSRKQYEKFNQALVLKTGMRDKYYDALRSKGYAGLKDINDAKISGYSTKNPLIMLNASDVKESSVTKLGNEQIKKDNTLASIRAWSIILAKNTAKNPTLVGGTAVVGTAAATAQYNKRSNESKIVAEYKKKHPGTKKSYTEIVRDYERQHAGE